MLKSVLYIYIIYIIYNIMSVQSRPFGTALLIGGVDEKGPQL